MSTSAATDRPFATLEGAYDGKRLSKRFPNEPSLIAYAEKLIRCGCRCRAGCADGRKGPKAWINKHLSTSDTLLCRIWCEVCQVEHRTISRVYICRKLADPRHQAERQQAARQSRQRCKEYRKRGKLSFARWQHH